MKISSIFSSNRVPWGFVLFAAAVAPIEILQVKYDYYLYRNSSNAFSDVDLQAGLDPLRMKVKNDDAWRGGNDYEVVALGDSSAIVAFYPDEFASRAGLSAYNLATFMSEGPRAPVYVLSNYLHSASRPPKYVIVCMITLAFFSDHHRPGVEYTFVRGNRMRILHDLGLGAFVKAHIPTLHHQTYLKDFLANLGNSGGPDITGIDGEIARFRSAKGAVPKNPDQVLVGSAVFNLGANSKEELRIPSSVTRSLNEIIDLAAQAGSKVVLILAPSAPAQYRAQMRGDAWPLIARLFAEIESAHDNVRVLDLQDQFLDNRYFVDVFHLNGAGAVRFCELVAEAIQADLNSNPIP